MDHLTDSAALDDEKRVLKNRYFVPHPSKAEAAFAFAAERIQRAVACGNWQQAREAAKDWGIVISECLRIPRSRVWKDFKRRLAAQWFGQPEKKVFAEGWSIEEALAYAIQFSGRNLRASSFPADIACHATSIRLSVEQHPQWREQLSSLRRDTLLEVFPESSTATSICFRRFASAFGEEIFYEAGHGQAMAVFEEEQGKHPTVHASRIHSTEFSWKSAPLTHAETASIGEKLKLLVEKHDLSLQMKCFNLCRKTGIEGVGLEGYFDPHCPEKVIVVDLDLPFDFAFMG